MPTSLADIERVQSLFPKRFNVLVECLKHDVAKVGLEVRFLRPSPAMCVLEEAEISFDPTFFTPDARQMIARGILTRTGVQVDPGEVAVWAFYHEIAHLKRGPDRARAVRQPLFCRPSLMDSIAAGEEEMECEEYAKERFKKWKRGQS
jgi:hypothetical protein